MQALKDAQAARAEAEQDADMIQAQLQQAQAEGSSRAGTLEPPSTPPAPRRTLSGKKSSASGLQVCMTAPFYTVQFLAGVIGPCKPTVMPCCNMVACFHGWTVMFAVAANPRASLRNGFLRAKGASLLQHSAGCTIFAAAVARVPDPPFM